MLPQGRHAPLPAGKACALEASHLSKSLNSHKIFPYARRRFRVPGQQIWLQYAKQLLV